MPAAAGMNCGEREETRPEVAKSGGRRRRDDEKLSRPAKRVKAASGRSGPEGTNRTRRIVPLNGF
jgi:hypothetical protein